MQSVQIIQPQSPILGGPPAEPTTVDGGFGQAFAEEPEAKSDPAVGGDGEAFVVPPVPTWFDVAGLTPGVAALAAGTIGPAPADGKVIEAGTTNSAEPAAETTAAPSGKLAETFAPAVGQQETALPSEPGLPLQTAVPLSADGPSTPPLSDPAASVPEATEPEVHTSVRDAGAGPRRVQGVEQPSGQGPAGDPTEAAESAEAPRHPVAQTVADGISIGRKSVGHEGERATDPIAPPVGLPAFPGRRMEVETGVPAAADAGADDLPPRASARIEALPVSVAPLNTSGADTQGPDTQGADIRNLSVPRAAPALFRATEIAPAPTPEVSPPSANTDVDGSRVAATDVAPAGASTGLPGHAGSETARRPVQVLSALQPEAKRVDTAPADFSPEADDPKGLLPGVWERLFTGILAPVLQTHEGPMASMTRLPSLAGIVPPESEPLLSADADPAPAHGSGEAPPPDGVDLRKTPFNGLAVVLAPKVVEPAPVPDTLQDLGEDAILPTLGWTGPASSAAPVAVSPQTMLALPVPQVAAQISAAVSRLSDGSTELSLAPEELGKVRLKLKPDVAHPDRMVVMITFERPETLELFRKHMGELADALRAAGYAGADIGFGQEGGSASGSDRRDRPAATPPDTAFRPDSPGISPPAARQLAGASLDLRL